MNPDPPNINALFQKLEANSLWIWNPKHKGNRFPRQPKHVLRTNRRKPDPETVLGPGGGIGIGCGVGAGIGFMGGIGFSGAPWNRVRPAIGIGMGCGVGVGFGYGFGLGTGFTLEALRSYVSVRKSDPDKRIKIQI